MRVNVTIPVLNEEACLRANIERLHQYLSENCPWAWGIVIADNGSTDGTPRVANQLIQQHQEITYFRLDQRGRGRALKKAWTESQADVLSYMDVDLSTDLAAFVPLIEALARDNYDLAVGSRLARDSRTRRSLSREFLSRGYNLLVKALFRTEFSDAQCGFKAVKKGVFSALGPLIENDHWFFDTELLLLAHWRGYPIKDVPVEWSEDTDSRVRVAPTIAEDIMGLVRMARKRRSFSRLTQSMPLENNDTKK